MSLTSLSSILRAGSPRTALRTGVRAATTVAAANQALTRLFGASIARSAEAKYVRNGVLAIVCVSGVVAQEIKLHEAVLLSAINRVPGVAAVRGLQMLAGG